MSKAAAGTFAVIGILLAAAGGYWAGTRQPAVAPVANATASSKGSAHSGGPNAGTAPAVTVEVIKVATAALPQTLTAVGSLRSDESVVLRPEVAGRVSAILFKEGQRVTKGAPLVRLDTSINDADVQQTRANLTLAKSKYQRAIDLQKQGFVSTQARDEAENNLRIAEASLALSEAKFAKTEIKAPFSGVIGLRQISVGDYVKEGADMVNLEAIDPLKVDFRIPEVYVSQLRTGQSLEVSLDSQPGRIFSGQVYAVNPLVDAAGRSVVVRALVRNPDIALRPGMFARVRLITRDVKDALVVPEQALVPQGDEQFVYRVVDSRANRVKVEVGQRREGRAEVLKGLVAGDMVVTAGQPKIRDGSQVKVARADNPAATASGNAGDTRRAATDKGANASPGNKRDNPAPAKADAGAAPPAKS